MSAKLPDGATVSIGTAFATLKTISAVTNASPPVAQSTAHGLTATDVIVVASGWSGLNDRVFKPTIPTVDTLGLVGATSVDVDRYPPGAGVGSFRKVTAWQQITQIMGWETTGGEPKTVVYSFLEEDFDRELASGSTPQSIKITIADDPSLPGYQALKAAADANAPTPLRLTLKGGTSIFYYATIFLNETPNTTKGQVMTVVASGSLQSKPVRA